jgi:hypothetical protein
MEKTGKAAAAAAVSAAIAAVYIFNLGQGQ